MERTRRRALLSWFSLGALAALCGILAVLQYRWIGEVSQAERGRIVGDLQNSLHRLSREFNAAVNTASWSLMPVETEIEQSGREAAYAARYSAWKARNRRNRLFGRVALAVPDDRSLVLRSLDLGSNVFRSAEWPDGWRALREHMQSRLGRSAPAPFPREEGAVFELPRFGRPDPERPGSFGAPEQEWLILELNLQYVRDVLLPELARRHLGAGGRMDYQVEVVTRTEPATIIYPASPSPAQRITRPDASVTLFEVSHEPLFRRRALGNPQSGLEGEMPGTPSGPPGRGRWQLLVRRSGDSLDAVVARARWLNLAVSGAILLLILAAAAVLIRFLRQAQKLAEIQMNFVAGVSHELRTPLAVIGTAAYNLQGRMAHNPSQVERYGVLIQQEARKLTGIVEQVLRFAGAHAGHIVRQREPLSVETLIRESVQSSRGVLEESRCTVEQRVEPGLPPILGDPIALKHAIENLLQNAVKYGFEGDNWIGIYASASGGRDGSEVEIRVADRGPGIPEEEQAQIFEPFFRGEQAVRNQIHGTGLGLNLVKRIIEAHHGTITVRSEPMHGAEFVVRIPVAPNGTSE